MLIKIKTTLKNFFSNRINLAFFLIFIFALSLRLYYFWLTKNQPLWWDEAEYMLKAKNIVLGTPETGWSSGIRPILFPFLASASFFLGLGEIPIRLVMVLISSASIILIYNIGNDLFNKKVGLFASIIMSVFYLDLFYTTRLLVDVPQIFFITLASFLFVKHTFNNGSTKLIWFVLPAIFIGLQMRFTVGLFAGILFLFLITKDGISLFKKKEWYISAVFAFIVMIPYLIYSWIKFNNPLFSIIQGISSSSTARGEGETGFSIFMQYIKYFPDYNHWIFFSFFIIGAILLLINLILGIDKIRSNERTQRYLFLVFATLIPVIYFGFFVNHFEDRYIFMIFPFVFIIAGFAVDKIYEFSKKYSHIGIIAVIALLLIYGSWQSLQRADDLIKIKLTSYQGLKDAGLWIKNNSLQNESIISAGPPEITYYSERSTYPYPQSESELLDLITEKNATYLILSIWEPSPQWTYDWPQRNSDKVEPIQGFFLDTSKQQFSSIVYKIKNS